MMPKLDWSLEQVTTATAYFRNRRILGLAFNYPSGKVSRIGIAETETHATAFFPDNSRVVGLSVAYSKEGEPGEIEFEVESDADADSVPAKLRLCVESPVDTLSDGLTDPHRRDMRWKDILAAQEGIRQSTFNRRDFVRPLKSKLVGIFVTCQRLATFGALYDMNLRTRTDLPTTFLVA